MENSNEVLVDVSLYESRFGLKNKLGRIIWGVGYWFLFRPFALQVFNRWRVFVLKCYGAKIEWSANIYASVKIWAPWNLEMGKNSCLGPAVDCYNQGRISIGDNSIISQKSYICASSHDFTNGKFPLIIKQVTIRDQVWVAADAFIGPGVIIEQGAVIGARAAVFKKVDAWTVVGGNPAVFIKERIVC
jgi:putative colanic acid biosynthesis acetyltransferase WcaF